MESQTDNLSCSCPETISQIWFISFALDAASDIAEMIPINIYFYWKFWSALSFLLYSPWTEQKRLKYIYGLVRMCQDI